MKSKQSNLKLLQEELAALEHEQWAHWTLHMLSHLTEENKMRWWKQTHIRYEDLSEGEKDKDRKWARQVLKILRKY
jgi:fatty-acid desaturase